jgi:hypothetical protein
MKTKATKKTYDVVFNSENETNAKGFQETLSFCRSFIDWHNGSSESFFPDYIGGTVSVVCNETGNIVYTTNVIK